MYKRQVFQWVPVHCGVEGNECADRLAGLAASMAPIYHPQYSLKNCEKTIESKIREEWTESWAAETTGRQLFEIQRDPAYPSSVSYTHLDVYKRQVMAFIGV